MPTTLTGPWSIVEYMLTMLLVYIYDNVTLSQSDIFI
jgi:hypothetical protein